MDTYKQTHFKSKLENYKLTKAYLFQKIETLFIIKLYY